MAQIARCDANMLRNRKLWSFTALYFFMVVKSIWCCCRIILDNIHHIAVYSMISLESSKPWKRHISTSFYPFMHINKWSTNLLYIKIIRHDSMLSCRDSIWQLVVRCSKVIMTAYRNEFDDIVVNEKEKLWVSKKFFQMFIIFWRLVPFCIHDWLVICSKTTL